MPMFLTRTLGLAGLFFSVIIVAAGCHKAPPAVAASKPPEVSVAYPIYGNVQDYEDFPGRTEAFKRVEVRARVSGELKAIHYQDGAEVKMGDPLFDIDPEPFDLELKRAQATLEQADANLELKTVQYNRAKELRGRTPPSISQDDLDVAKADVNAARATRSLADANKRIAELNLRWCHITAEIDGKVSRRNFDVGNQIAANVTPLTTIVRLDKIYANLYVDERTVIRLRQMISRQQQNTSEPDRQLRVKIALANEDEGHFSLEGVVDSSNSELDAGTGTLPVRAILPNPLLASTLQLFVTGSAVAPALESASPQSTRLLSPNMFVRIRFPVGEEHRVLMVPEEALVSDQGIRHLFVLNQEDKVERRIVKLGQLQKMKLDPQGDEVEMRVIEEGLKDTDRVIVAGLQRVRAGIKVTVRTAEKKGTGE
jgi:RND family efflux transporter MFP subunit